MSSDVASDRHRKRVPALENHRVDRAASHLPVTGMDLWTVADGCVGPRTEVDMEGSVRGNLDGGTRSLAISEDNRSWQSVRHVAWGTPDRFEEASNRARLG